MAESGAARETFPGAVLPARAIGDPRLKGAHWRVLAAVAYHDRLGKNGQGCWASYGKLAEETGLDLTTVSKAICDLVEWGFLFRRRNTNPKAKDKRTRELRVIYLESQAAEWNGESANQWPTDHESLVDGVENAGSWVDWPEGDPAGPEIDGPQAMEFAEIDGPQARLKKILLSASKKNPVETASASAAACSEDREDFPDDRRELASRLRKVEDALKATDGRLLSKGEVQYFAHHRKQCSAVAMETIYQPRRQADPTDQKLGFWAERLATDIDHKLDEAAA